VFGTLILVALAAVSGFHAAPRPNAKPGTIVKTASSDYGQILFSGSDRAIYRFGKEGSSKPRCYGPCAQAWPPVLTKGKPRARSGADASLLGTTRRSDGSKQVTYKRRPLYYYVNDPSGRAYCHNVTEYGGLWVVVQPSGEPVS
jgi:predicted lipoprotein with Yx(FWY)xxD motif